MKPSYDYSTVMFGGDTQMDQQGIRNDPINLPPAKCKHCGAPNLAHVAQPYLLKGTGSPRELAEAVAGNFFVKTRARQILETVLPGQCQFYPTHELKTRKSTPWFLAVPTHQARTATPLKHIQKCPVCGEPKGCGVDLCDVHPICWQGRDILKTSNWIADTQTAEDVLESMKRQGIVPHPLYLQCVERRRKALGVEPHPGLWTREAADRLLHFSMRLQELLKRAELKGLKNELGESRPLTPQENAWVDEKLQLLAGKRLVELEEKKPTPSAGKISPALARWFAAYLRKNASASPKRYNFEAIEKKQAVALPSSYKEFISQIGEKEYVDVDGIDGFTARILPPTKFNFKSYRRGKLDCEELAELDCILFAVTGHGDGFCFDVASPGPDYPVYHYQHELGMMELYARNFAECIKRFSI